MYATGAIEHGTGRYMKCLHDDVSMYKKSICRLSCDMGRLKGCHRLVDIKDMTKNDIKGTHTLACNIQHSLCSQVGLCMLHVCSHW